LLKCTRCKSVFYCAPACQSRDWSKHKGSCKADVAESSAATATTASAAAVQSSSATAAYGLCAADCGKPAVLRCAGCLGAFYCGQACQKRAWKQHRDQCKDAAKMIASMNCVSIDDFDEKFALFKMEAEAGDAAAQFDLGLCYEHGSGVAVDKAEAVKWFKRAAEAGYTDAQFNLGVCYDKGSGVAVDKTEAVKWYKRAAEAGNAQAQFNIGVCYHEGLGVAVDNAEAVK